MKYGRISSQKQLVLNPKDTKTLFGFKGQDYYSNKPVAVKKRWLVDITQPGIYEIDIEL